MKVILIVCFWFLFINSNNAQFSFQKTLGGLQDDVIYSVKETIDNGFIAVGYTNSLGFGGYDIFLIKTNPNGDTLWSKTYGGVSDDYGYGIQQTKDSGYIVVGSTKSFGPGWENIFLLKIDSDGNSQWTKVYKPFGIFGQNGGSGIDVKQTYDGGYILDCVAPVSSSELLLIKTDSAGDSLWTKTFGMNVLSFGTIIQTIDSGYIVTGASAGNLQYDVYLIKIDINGNLVWKKNYGSTHSDFGYSVCETMDRGLMILGTQDSIGGGAYLIQTNSTGDTVWTKILEGCGGYFINNTNNGGFIIAGSVQDSFGYADACIIKIDSSGNIIWAKSFGGNNYDYCFSVQQTIDRGYIAGGYCFGLGSGNNDCYLIKTDSIGNSGCNNQSISIPVKSSSTMVNTPVDTNYFISNVNYSSNSFNISEGSFTHTLCSSVGNNEVIEMNLTVFPNPTSDEITIANLEGQEVIEIYDLLGKVYITVFNIFDVSTTLNVSQLQSGIYFLSINCRNKFITEKLIITK